MATAKSVLTSPAISQNKIASEDDTHSAIFSPLGRLALIGSVGVGQTDPVSLYASMFLYGKVNLFLSLGVIYLFFGAWQKDFSHAVDHLSISLIQCILRTTYKMYTFIHRITEQQQAPIGAFFEGSASML